MVDEFDQLQSDLQEMIIAEARKLYSETVIDHAMNPRNTGEIIDADGYGHALGSCGDDMEIWLCVKNGNISEATFFTNGCSTTIASGSMITEMVKDKTLKSAQEINGQHVLRALDGLPEDSEHCAQLAANTLKEAIKDYLKIQREPWKKVYKKR